MAESCSSAVEEHYGVQQAIPCGADFAEIPSAQSASKFGSPSLLLACDLRLVESASALFKHTVGRQKGGLPSTLIICG